MELFMTLIGIFIVGYFLYLFINSQPNVKSFLFPSSSSKLIFSKSFLDAFKEPAIQKKLFFTILILVVYRILYFIPIPGVDTGALTEFFHRIEATSHGNINHMMMRFSGGVSDKVHLMVIGFMPYLSACVLLQLLSVIISPLRKIFFDLRSQGRQQVIRMSFILGLIMCALQAFMISLWLENLNSFMGLSIVSNPGWGFRLVATLSITVTFCLIIWLANLISDKGIGNGFAILILSDILVGLGSTIFRAVIDLSQSGQFVHGLAYLISLIPLFFLALFATNWTKDFSVKMGATAVSIPIRLSWVARQPTQWAQGLVLLPATLASFLPSSAFQNLAGIFRRGGVPYYAVMSILIVIVSLGYRKVVFSVKFLNQLTSKFFQSNIDNENDLKNTLNKGALLLGLLLVVFAILPDVVMVLFKLPYFMASIYAGASFLIIIGVLSDVAVRIKSWQKSGSCGCEEICAVAFDEVEALIKQKALEQQGVQSVVEPIRFTWGMPIRTAIDEYRIKVKQKERDNAVKVLS